MNKLASAGLISMDEACCITSTEAGRLMSIYYLDLETMKLIMKLEGSEPLERLLWLICESHELSDMHLRVDERRCLNSLNRNTATATIRFPMKGKINSRQMKLSCVIQAVLGCLFIPEPSLNQEALKIMRIADRVCKCLVYYVTRPNFISQNPKFYLTILNSLVLAKCIYARLWENSPYVSRQLKGIGQIFSTLLASAGKVNFMLLEESHPRDLERIMNKGPPAGNVIRRQVSLLPKYNLTATPIDEKTVKIQLSLLNNAHLSENIEQLTAGASHKSYVVVGDSENYLIYLTSFKDSDLINVYDGCMTFEVTRKHNSKHEILIHCISSTFVGIDEQCKYLFNDINPIPTYKPVATYLPEKKLENLHDDEIDVFKERKRKAKETDKSQCNEKKKRDINSVEKFKQLKESFGRTSRDINVNHHKKKEMSDKILDNLVLQQDNTIMDKEFDSVIGDSLDQNIVDAFAEDFNDEDFVDDKQVSDILNEIENEIKNKNEIPLNNNQISSKPICPKNIFDQKKSVHINAKRKTLTTKNNYNFIDFLEKEDNNDGANTDICQETGFTNTVKGQIEQFLQKAYNYNNNKIDIIDLIEPTERNDKKVIQEVNNDEDVYELIDLTETEKKSMNSDEIKSEEINADCASRPGNDTNTSHWIAIKPDECSLHFTNNQNNKGTDNITINNKHLELYGNVLKISDEIQIDEPITENKLALATYPLYLQNIKSSKLSNPNKNIAPSMEKWKKSTNVLSSNTHSTSTDMGNKETNIKCTSINGDNIEYIKNYHASQTKLINITSENDQKNKVQIIGKLKVDLDITEIVHKNDTRNVDVPPDIIECNDMGNENDTNINKSHYFGERNKAIAYKTNPNIGNVYNDKNEEIVDITKDNVPFKKLLNDNEYSNNFKSDMNSTLQHDKNTESASVKDILQKYNNNLKRPIKEETNVNTQINKKKEENTKSTIAIGNKRKLRISDIDKIQIELPPSLIGESQKTTDSKYIDYKHRELQREIKEKDSDIDEMHYETQPEIVNNNIPEVDIGDLDSDLLYPDLAMELADYNTDFDVNDAMLDPKALLQNINKDDDGDDDNGEEDDEIIPPPPQFCDDNTYSPIYTSPENKISDITEYSDLINTQNINEIDTNEDDFMFDENNEFDLTPSKEIETWSPSRENSSVCSTESQSFTVMRKNLAETNNRHNFFNSRREKLSQFKFKRKSMFRK
ncbi:unnamed protein product, partial [Brenthis ino]